MGFYDDEYWQHGQGRFLWELRKVQAFIQLISNDETPVPFLTPLLEDFSELERDGGGWVASWGELSNKIGQLTVEYEDNAFMVYAFLPYDDKDKLVYEFWYHFGNAGDGTPVENVNSWDDLGKAVDSARNWLLKHKDELKEDRLHSLQKLFSIETKEA